MFDPEHVRVKRTSTRISYSQKGIFFTSSRNRRKQELSLYFRNDKLASSKIYQLLLASRRALKTRTISIAWIGRLDRNAAQNLKIGALVNQLLVKINLLLTYINCWQSPKIIKWFGNGRSRIITRFLNLVTYFCDIIVFYSWFRITNKSISRGFWEWLRYNFQWEQEIGSSLGIMTYSKKD